MVFFEITPEHVLHAVGGVEDAGAEALFSFFESIEEHLLAIVVVGITLREERIVIQNFLVQRPGVFG